MKSEKLVARERELGKLRRRIERDDRSVVIVGGAGVGKSALWRQTLSATMGMRALCSVTATRASQSIPLGAFASELKSLPIKKLGSTQLLGLTIDHLRQRGGDRQLVLGVDNIDMLDDSSATAVDQLVRGHHATLVATATTTTVPRWLRQLIRQGYVDRMKLDRLDRAGSDTLARHILSGEIHPRLAGDLWTVTRGNPAQILAVLEHSVDSGAAQIKGAQNKGAQWELIHPLGVSGDFGRRIDAQLERLAPEQRRTLELVALSEPTPLRLLEVLASSALVEQLERTVLTVSQDGKRTAVALTDRLLARRLEQSMPVVHRRRLIRELAEWYGDAPCNRDVDPVRVSNWSLEAGVDLDPVVARNAALQLLDDERPAETEHICRHALRSAQDAELEALLARSLLDQFRDVESALTARQTQIALLAATHTNSEIAERLSISRRTVENHLNAAFQALGVHNRADLAEVLVIKVQGRNPVTRVEASLT